MNARRSLLGMALFALALPLLAAAQDRPTLPPFATNTPPGYSAPLLVTNTPSPTPVTPDGLRPAAPLDRYALRLWTETDLTRLLSEQVQRSQPAAADSTRAVQALQYELERRFPGAPRDMAQRQALLTIMLAAPRGSADLRPVVRPYIEQALNRLRPAFDAPDRVSLEVDGFGLTILPANLDGDPATADAVVLTRYPAALTGALDVQYQDYVAAQRTAFGAYRVLVGAPAFPAAPLEGVRAVSLEQLADLNGDGVAEIALGLHGDALNRELLIYGWRGGQIANLIAPGAALRFGSPIRWPAGDGRLVARVYRVESSAWDCLGERDETWSWSFNYFRPPVPPPPFALQDSLGCRLYQAEPLFEQPVEPTIQRLQAALQTAQPEDAAAAQRAGMVLAMLHVLNGRADLALEQTQQLRAEALPGSWLAGQLTAFDRVASEPNTTPVQVCAALEAAGPDGACNVDQLLTRLLAERPFRRDQPVEAQLAVLGINVLDKLTLSEVGRFDRQAFRFDLGTDRWWAFAPLDRETYQAEPIAPPAGFTRTTETPLVVVEPPPAVWDALLRDNQPEVALTVLANAVRDFPGVPLSSSARYVQALSYDLLSDRNNARAAYYALWSDDPASIWGQLAAAHLERR